MTTNGKRITIASGSGFVGRDLAQKLKAKHRVRLLGRSLPDRIENGLELRPCDAFSLLDIEKSLKGTDVAVYLIHSMAPKKGLTQGHFFDLDLIVADNFARAAKRAGVKRIVYLGGLIPKNCNLSSHLLSRLEVERVLAGYGTPLVVARAGLIVGAEGSSYQILRNLVKRLPVMVCPSWTKSLTQPIALDDASDSLVRCIENDYDRLPTSETLDAQAQTNTYKILNIGCRDALAYSNLIERTARVLGGKTTVITVPMNSYHLSKLWVRTFASAPKSLVDPLVESLKHSMIADNNVLAFDDFLGRAPLDVEAMVEVAETSKRSLKLPREQNSQPNLVRSVQRLPLPRYKSIHWLAYRYGFWLKRYFRSFFDIRVKAGSIRFYKLNTLLLEMSYAADRSYEDRALFYITGGALQKHDSLGRGRLEFRRALSGEFAITAIHDFEPSLPWPVYTNTQAPFHLLVIEKFAAYLQAYEKRQRLAKEKGETKFVSP